MRNSVESLLRESYSLNRLLHYKKAVRVMHCKVLSIILELVKSTKLVVTQGQESMEHCNNTYSNQHV